MCPICNRHLVKAKWDFRPQNRVYFLKISNFIDSMKNGEIWLQSPKYYQDYYEEGVKTISDEIDSKLSLIEKFNEEQTAKRGIKFNQLNIGGNIYKIPENTMTSKIELYDLDSKKKRLMCFYTLETDKLGNYAQTPNANLINFGDFFSIVDLVEFRKILKDNLMNLVFTESFIRYYTDKYEGLVSPFHKRYYYGWQNEYRFVFMSDLFAKYGEKEPHIIKNLKGLSDVFTDKIPIDRLLNCKNATKWL